jgi:hypothetical protein
MSKHIQWWERDRRVWALLGVIHLIWLARVLAEAWA